MAYLKLFRELWSYAGGERWKISAFIILHVLSCVAGLLQPLVFAQILNILQTHPDHLFHSVLTWMGAWVGLFLWFNLFHRVGRYLEFDVAYAIKRKMLNEYYKIATNLPLSWHADHHSGDTISRINTAANALSDFVQAQYAFITYFMFFWGPIVGLAVLSWEISIAALLVAVMTIALISKFDRQLVVLYNEMNSLSNRVSAGLYDYIGNIRTVITLRLGQQTGGELDHRLQLGYRPYIRAEAVVNAGKWFMISSCTLLLEAGLILFYVWRQPVVRTRRPDCSGGRKRFRQVVAHGPIARAV